MRDVLKTLVDNSFASIDRGVYDIRYESSRRGADIRSIITNYSHAPLITEIKFSSPSQGRIRRFSDPVQVASQMISGGAVALSILTQPLLFGGSPEYLVQVRKSTRVPLLMKDIIVHRDQVDAARRMGADCILLISSLFAKGYLSNIDDYIRYAHQNNLQVLLEIHTIPEMRAALESDADIIGINNRDLDTLKIDIATTGNILSAVRPDRPVISESGIHTPSDIRYLRECGATAFLVGSSIMESDNIEAHVADLVRSY